MIHRFNDFRDLGYSWHGQVPILVHHFHNVCELLEVVSFRCPQSILPKERDDRLLEVAASLHAIPEEILAVIVMPAIQEDLSTSEKRHKIVKYVTAGSTLSDSEFGTDLPSQGHRVISEDGNAETAVSIYESHDPFAAEPFLLIVRRDHSIVTHRRIFTVHAHKVRSTCDTNEYRTDTSGVSSI
jgi:hypothetical protein